MPAPSLPPTAPPWRQIGAVAASVTADTMTRSAGTCPGTQYGLWSDSTPPVERACRLRALRMAVRLLAGPAGAAADIALGAAEHDPAALPAAIEALDRLAPLPLRRVLSTYAAMHRPTPAGGAHG